MAMTATISSLNPGSTVIEQPVRFVVVVTNSGASSFSVTEIQPTCVFTGNSPAKDGSSAALGKVFLSGAPIAPGDSQTFMFYADFHVPSVNADGTQGSYDVNCKIQNSIGDAAIVAASPVVMSVTQVPKEASTP